MRSPRTASDTAPRIRTPHDFGVLLPTRRKARIDQWDLDAEVAVDEHDRERLEHLCRHLLRPPLALDRLRLLADARVCIELERPWSDLTTLVTMTPDAFIARLATLVPRPRRNTTIYFGRDARCDERAPTETCARCTPPRAPSAGRSRARAGFARR